MARRLQHATPWRHLVHRDTGECLGAVLKESPGNDPDGEEDDESWWMVLWSPARPREQRFPDAGVGEPWPLRLPLQL